jgi:hypothetical protein
VFGAYCCSCSQQWLPKQREKEMPKYQFVEHEYTKNIITFEADSLDHAKELMCDQLSHEDLPNGEKFFKTGEIDWEEPREAKEDN